MELDYSPSGKMEVMENLSLTLLSSPMANTVSLLTRSSSLYLRLSTLIGEFALNGVRITTLTGLELSRAIMENILIRAGKDLADRSSGKLGKMETEGLLEKSLNTLHSTITKMSFAASTSLYISSAALNSACDMSQLLLTALDSVLGSTDSSRAIASIITLIRREFQNPATGQEGEKVGVMDLLVGICGLAFLQRWCSEIIDDEKNSAQVVWDVVVSDDGKRADITEDIGIALIKADSMIFMPTTQKHALPLSERESKATELSDKDLLEVMLRKRISMALPPNASVSISTQTSASNIITVVITGAKPPNLSPLPGLEVIEEGIYYTKNPKPSQDDSISEAKPNSLIENFKTVYRMTEASLKITSKRPADESIEIDLAEQVSECTPELDSRAELHFSPRKKPDNFRQNILKNSEGQIQHNNFTDNIANQKRPRVPRCPSISNSSDYPGLKTSMTTSPTKSKLEHISPGKMDSIRNCIKRGSVSALSSLFGKAAESSISRSTSEPNERVPSNSAIRPLTSFTSVDIPRPLGHLKDSSQGSENSASHQYALWSGCDPLKSHSAFLHFENPITESSESGSEPSDEFITQLRASKLLRAKSEKQISSLSSSNLRKSKSFVFSVHNRKDGSDSLAFSQPSPSAFSDLNRLSRTGFVDGMFPEHHLVKNITRYVRFASASYGSNFLRFMGISSGDSGRGADAEHHHEHHSFSTHTQLPPSTILLSSFVDPQGGTDSSGNTNTGVPMVHYVSLDHDFKAVVLTCRGTLGFEDVLTDMTCDYDDIVFLEKTYKVHKGIHASARRLLNGKVMATITATLKEFPEYGLVMCGHSLGGAVSALLAVMISEPDPKSTAFYTTSVPLPILNKPSRSSIRLPTGRRVHVYAYGPPATMSPSLRIATRGLITTIVNHQDIVPCLSLGLLHDLQAIALAFKTDDTGAKSEVNKRVWRGMAGKFADVWYNRQGMMKDEDDQWAYSTLKTLRACMLSTKLVPPGEVFVVETMPVLQRHGFINGPLGRPAKRVVVRYIKDVEKRFGELQFGGSMLLDHSPGRYEASLRTLGKGVLVRR
ncbi:hypothetical protein K3495_g2982 [Podosphaera aphanis]|nr:hypothetical protein K3495_g2982 [Podosphaera aphanis]